MSGTGRTAGGVTALKDEDPDTDSSPTATPSTTSDDGKVWVNTKSGVIWQPGSRYYGKIKESEYMTAADAVAAGCHYAK